MRRLFSRQSLHVARMHAASRQVPLAIRLIAGGKIIKGVLFIVAGLIFAKVIHAPDAGEAVKGLLAHLHIDPEGTRVQHLATWIDGLPHARLAQVGAGLFAYATLYLIEGLGLWFDRYWAEWLTVVGTSLLVPFEIHHLVIKPGWGIGIALLVNLAVVAYLGWRIWRRRKQALAPAGQVP